MMVVGICLDVFVNDRSNNNYRSCSNNNISINTVIKSLLIIGIIYGFVCGLLFMWNLEKPIPEREKRGDRSCG